MRIPGWRLRDGWFIMSIWDDEISMKILMEMSSGSVSHNKYCIQQDIHDLVYKISSKDSSLLSATLLAVTVSMCNVVNFLHTGGNRLDICVHVHLGVSEDRQPPKSHYLLQTHPTSSCSCADRSCVTNIGVL